MLYPTEALFYALNLLGPYPQKSLTPRFKYAYLPPTFATVKTMIKIIFTCVAIVPTLTMVAKREWSSSQLCKILVTFIIGIASSSSWADWAVTGASYQCSKKNFSLHASIESSGGNIPPPPGSKPLKYGRNVLKCNLGKSVVNATIDLTGPGRNGECGDGGTILIAKLHVNNQAIVESGEPMIYYCTQTPSIVRITISKHTNGISSDICRGSWNWGTHYENIACTSSTTKSTN